MSITSPDPLVQRRIPAVFVRGGTSKGLFFHERDLPRDPAERDHLFLSAIGSPDPYRRQLDGMGGGVSSLSKVVVVGPPTHPDADVDYTFAQVAVSEPLVDYGATCGNLASAVGPFAYDEGLVSAQGREAVVRIHAVNIGKLIVARFQVAGGAAEVRGDFALPGVAGSGAPVRLEFLEPGGAATGRLLPAGSASEIMELGPLGRLRVSLVDAAAACVFVRADDLGLTGVETPADIDANPGLAQRLEAIRAAAGVRMGLGSTPDAITRTSPASPKVAIVGPPRTARLLDGRESSADAMDLNVRMISMGQAHRAVPLTGALCLAAAARISGTVVQEVAPPSAADRIELRVGTPSGVFSVAALVEHDGEWKVRHAAVYRTARRLMEGSVLIPMQARP